MRTALFLLTLAVMTGCAEPSVPVTAQVEISVQAEVKDLVPSIGTIQPGDQCRLGEWLRVAKIYAYRKITCDNGLTGYILPPNDGDFQEGHKQSSTK